MRFGVCTSIENINAAQSVGFDYIEVSASEISALSKEAFDEKITIVRAADIRCECWNILFPATIMLLGNSATNRNELEKYLHHTFERVSMLSGEVVVFGSGKSRSCPPDMNFFDAHRQLLRIIAATGRIAGEYGLSIAVEPLNRTECNAICSIVEGAIFVMALNLQNINLLADGYHMFMNGEPLSDIKKIGKFAHIHIARKDGRLFPTTKDELLVEFFSQLCDIGYDHRVSVEGKTDNFKVDSAKSLSLMRELAHSVCPKPTA